MGRIGLAFSPADPDVIYALVEAWARLRVLPLARTGARTGKMSDASTGSASTTRRSSDPKKVDGSTRWITWMMVTEDGGKAFAKVGESSSTVDNPPLWIDPTTPIT